MRAPKFVREEAGLAEAGREAKRWACPHCGRQGRLNGHGVLRGCAEDRAGGKRAAVRGRRFYCSNRGRRGGCGRTFAILLGSVLARASVRTAALWRFYAARLGGGSVLSAWERARSRFSVEAAYRWWQRWPAAEIALRQVLCRMRGPPAADLAAAVTAAYGPADPIGGYQVKEQRRWP